MGVLVSPSLLSANFANLEKDIQTINNSNADFFHIDVMDGVFVPNISFGFPVIKQINILVEKPLDVHLMIINPDKYIEDFKNVGSDILTIHYEACTHLHRTIQNIKSKGMKAGVSLNPHTPVNLLKDIIKEIDLVLIMSVNPGFGGQEFIENSYNKIAECKNLILQTNSKALIEVDGGVNNINAPELVKSGADILVAGNYIFKSDNIPEAVNLLKNA